MRGSNKLFLASVVGVGFSFERHECNFALVSHIGDVPGIVIFDSRPKRLENFDSLLSVKDHERTELGNVG